MASTRRIFPILILLLSQVAAAQGIGEARTFDSPTLRLQAKAEEQYQAGHWKRAYWIYVNDLAAVGDKYAQYMAGYMWQHGKGMDPDDVRASAWYRLAAERGDQEFVAVRDEILESMGESERASSDQAFVTLRRKYSDLVLALEHLRNEREILNETPTGSRLSGNSSTVTIIDPRTGLTITRSEYVRRIETSMRLRLNYITSKLDIDAVDPNMTDNEFDELVNQVDAYLRVVNDR